MYAKKFLNRFFGKVIADELKVEIKPWTLASGVAISAAADAYGYLAGDSEFPGPMLMEMLAETRMAIEASAPSPEDLQAFRLMCSGKAAFLTRAALARIPGGEEVIAQFES